MSDGIDIDGEDFDALIERLNERQDVAMDKREGVGSDAKKLYFSGKDLGLAEAKAILREEFNVCRESKEL